MLRHLRIVAASALLAAVAIVTSPARCTAAPAVLHWTAPGDDGATGTATRYQIRRSSSMITPANFAAAESLSGAPAPAPAGTAQSFTVDVPQDGKPWYFALRAVDEVGNWSAISNIATFTAPTLDADPNVPLDLAFSGPWPNPAHQVASLRLSTPREVDSDIAVFDILGRHVRTLWAGTLEPGVRTIRWDLRDDQGRAVAPGTWFVRARCGSDIRVRRVVVSH